MIELEIRTRAHSELVDLTAQVQKVVAESGIQEGICHIFAPHTTAGLTLNENWDPTVRDDLVQALEAMAPEIPYRHTEGNSPSHLKATLVGTHATLFVNRGRLVLGSWQGIFLAEFDGPRHRQVLIKVVPDPEGTWLHGKAG